MTAAKLHEAVKRRLVASGARNTPIEYLESAEADALAQVFPDALSPPAAAGIRAGFDVVEWLRLL